jgi:hypothetical protein
MSSAALPFPESICHRCSALKRVKGANSTFLMCTALERKYPPQPVLTCEAFAASPQAEPSAKR